LTVNSHRVRMVSVHRRAPLRFGWFRVNVPSQTRSSAMSISDRLGCSTIRFRHLVLPEALAVISELGFGEIDLGALPGVCDHVPYVLDRDAVSRVASEVATSGLAVRSVNGDVGDLNAILDNNQRAGLSEHLDRLLDL